MFGLRVVGLGVLVSWTANGNEKFNYFAENNYRLIFARYGIDSNSDYNDNDYRIENERLRV